MIFAAYLPVNDASRSSAEDTSSDKTGETLDRGVFVYHFWWRD